MRKTRRRLVWQLYPSYLLLILVILLAVGWYMTDELRSYHYRRTTDDLLARAELIEGQLQGKFADSYRVRLNEQVRQLGQESHTRITVIRKDGRVLADSLKDARQMENHGSRPEVRQALSGQRGMSVRFSTTLGQTLTYVSLPVYAGGELVGCVRTALPVSDIDATLHGLIHSLLVGGLVLAFLLAPLCWWLSRYLSRPLELMTAGAQRFSRGEFDQPLEITGSEETRRLAAAMNNMAVELDVRIVRESEQRAEIEAILGSMEEGFVAVDRDERIIRLNRAASEFFNVPLGQSSGRLVQELIRQAELQRFIHRALDLQQPLEEELVLHLPKRRYLHVLATPLLGTDQQRIGVLVVLHDLTRLRQLESLRRDFVANVSHELKTPITAIQGSVETLLGELECGDQEQRFLQIIAKQGERLGALVEDLLELSRIEQGREKGFEFKHTQLLPLFLSARAACDNLISQQQIALQLACPADLGCRINAQLLEQALINLLSNAIKYSEPGSRVLVSAQEQPDTLELRVQDFGCGIAAEHLPRLFERFYRVDRARSRKLGGTGLGLAIVKHVAQAHHGEVRVESTPGEGSTFSLVLPLQG